MDTLLRMRPIGSAAIDAAFDEVIRRGFTTTWTPPADIVMDGEDAIITLELAGLSGADVEVKDRILTVTGHRTLPADLNRVRSEIRQGDFARSFRIPGHVSADAVTAHYENGLLSIRVSGANPTPVSRKVEITGMPAVQGQIGDREEEATAA